MKIDIAQGLEGLLDLNRVMERTLVDVVAAYTPWLAPVAPAYLAWVSMTNVLVFPWWIALPVAIAVEALGVSTVNTALTFWRYNQEKRQSDPEAPTWLAIIAAGTYLTVVVVVNVLLDPADWLAKVAKFLLSILSIVGAITLGLRSQHGQRMETIRKDKAEKRAARQASGKSPGSTGDHRKGSGQGSGESGPVYKAWPEIPESEWPWIAQASAAEIVKKYRLRGKDPERTGRNWRTYAIERTVQESVVEQPETDEPIILDGGEE